MTVVVNGSGFSVRLVSDGSETDYGFDVVAVVGFGSPGALLTAVSGSGCVVDEITKTIYGLTPGLSDLDGLVAAAPGYRLNYIATPAGFGTGTLVQVLEDTTAKATPAAEYTLILFGDVNGDSILDGNDAGMMIDYENYRFEWDPVQEFYLFIAGDLNGDGNVSVVDADILVETENWNMVVDQSTGLAELL